MKFKYVELEFEKLNREIIELSRDRPSNFIEIGRKLRLMKKAEVYKEGGYDNFYKYVRSLKSTKGKMDYSTAQSMIRIFKHYFSIICNKWEREILKEIGWSKLREIVKYSRAYCYLIRFINANVTSPAKEIIHIPVTLNVTKFINKGLQNTRKTIKEDVKEFYKDIDTEAIYNGDDKLLGPPMRTIEKNWNRARYRMYCTCCGENEVDCFKVKKEINEDENSDLIESTYFAVTSQGTKFKKLHEAKETRKKEGPDRTLRMMSLMWDRTIKTGFTFECRNCGAHQYILQLDHEIINK